LCRPTLLHPGGLESKDAVRKVSGYAPDTLVLGSTSEIELR
jgi:hypothetical protein